MAISLNKDGLYVNYPSSTIKPSNTGSYPVGCVVVISMTKSDSKSFSGTWAVVEQAEGNPMASVYVGSSILNPAGQNRVYALAIRVA